jgi:predicted MFS family arabinose efflux permease
MVRHYQHHYNNLPANLKLFLMGHALMAFGNSVHGLLFNLFLRESGLKEGVMGSLASTTSLGTALMAFPAAFVLERFAAKPLLITGLIISALCYIAQVLSSNVELYTLFGLMGAMGLAIFNISVAPFIFRHTKPEDRVYAFTLNSAAVMGSQLLGFMMGGQLPEIIVRLAPSLTTLEAYRYSMACALGITLLSLWPYSRILKAPVPKVTRRMLGELKARDWNTLTRLVAPKVSIALGAGMIIPFMNVYLSKRFDLGSAAIGNAFGVLQLCMFSGIFLGPLLVRRMDRLRFMMFTALLSIPFMLTMALASSVILVLGSFFMRGMLMNMSGPVTSLFEMEKVKEQECLFASCILIFSYNAAWTFSSQVGGWLIETYGFRSSFFAAAIFYTIAVGFYWTFFRHHKRSVSEQSCVSSEAA